MPPGFSQSLRQSQRQEMLLLPRMLQAVEVLQLPAVELTGYLLEAFEENEALALDEEGWTDPVARRGTRDDSERHDEWLRNQPDRAASLGEVVEEQLGMMEVEPDLLPWVRLVVSSLDENGYLSVPDETLLALAADRGVEGDAGMLGRAIAIVQRMEPRGIGGRNAIEALLLQLDPKDPDYALLCRLLEDFLEEIARNKLPAVAKAIGVDLDQLNGLLERLRELELRPAAGLVGEAPPAIHPDVVVEEAEDGFVVKVDQSGLPPLRVDPDVRALSRNRALGKDVRRHLRGRIDQARWVLQAVAQRGETLQRVATAVFGHQRAFLERGPGHLLPLRMNQLAEWLDLHTSTVSRAVAGKYAQTPWGIFPLRWFFQGSAGSVRDAAREDVRDLVREVVDAEDPRRPLSDDEIVAALKERGCKLARRTVAKYRGELGIPSSYRRRRYGESG